MINILGICDNAEILSVLRLVRIVIKAMQIAVPIILIVTLSINFSQAVASHDANALSKAKTKAIFQGIAAVVIFAVPTLVSTLMKITINDDTYKTCLQNATQENIDLAYETRAKTYMNNARTQLTREAYTIAKNNLRHIKDPETKAEYEAELEQVLVAVEAKELVEKVRSSKNDNDYQKAVDAVSKIEDKELRQQLEDELEEISLTMTKYIQEYSTDGKYIENPLGLPYYGQCDSRWGGMKYDIGGGPNGGMATLCSSSCGYTSFSMIAAGLNRNMSITPPTVVEKMRGISISAGQFTRRGYGAASTSELMNSSFMSYYNLTANKVTAQSGESFKQALMRELNSGKAAVILVPGHYMVLTPSGDGNVVLLDPFSNWADSRRKSGKQTLDNVRSVYGGITYAIAYQRN